MKAESAQTEIVRLHRSAHREVVANRDDAFLDGVCHALDVLRELGEDGAADRAEAALFKPVGAGR